MGEVRKYAFDTEFALNGEILRDPHGKPTRFTVEELEKECAAAYERGKKDALAEAERAAAAALKQLADNAAALLAALDKESKALRADAVHVALAAARKISGAALDAYGPDLAATAIEAAMDALRHQPRLLVRVSEATAETLRPRLESITEAHAYAGAVLLRPEPSMKAGEIVIDWSDGVVSLDPQDVAKRVEALMEAALNGVEHNV